MQINPFNTNQHLYFENTYRGLPVMQHRGPLVEQYLGTLHRVVYQALYAHRRLCAIRFDLRFPVEMFSASDATTNQVMSRFIESLKAKVRHNRACAKERDPSSPDTDLRYVWAREASQDGRVHYHVAILLNRDAFFTLGHFTSDKPNMAKRIVEAWASALGLPAECSGGLVHFPQNAVYRFDANSQDDLAAFFYRVSYLCKADTKHFGHGHHGFGASRH